MTQPFLGEIQLFGFNYAPYGWALCNGTQMSVSQNTALFSLIGTLYGGNGQTTFQLPNFCARAGCSQGQGLGLSSRTAGESFGEAAITLLSSEMPAHTHSMLLYGQPTQTVRSGTPSANDAMLSPLHAEPFPPAGTAPNTTFSPTMLGVTGQSLPHENQQPLLAMNYCISLNGDFPRFS
ncbi:phage tail protein [Ralstonia sp. UBA689]|uniref:phage tail protein n=1 Tax=Ralstonia sp. UBA689 TaxID=1947373 RepID=UPI0025E124F0|nr:tail fiber protein [Ralstonia sp. UBA689]